MSGFVLGWILRWEAVNTTFDPDRVRRHWTSLRPPTTSTPDLGPRLDPAHGVVSTRPASTGPFEGVDCDRAPNGNLLHTKFVEERVVGTRVDDLDTFAHALSAVHFDDQGVQVKG